MLVQNALVLCYANIQDQSSHQFHQVSVPTQTPSILQFETPIDKSLRKSNLLLDLDLPANRRSSFRYDDRKNAVPQACLDMFLVNPRWESESASELAH